MGTEKKWRESLAEGTVLDASQMMPGEYAELFHDGSVLFGFTRTVLRELGILGEGIPENESFQSWSDFYDVLMGEALPGMRNAVRNEGVLSLRFFVRSVGSVDPWSSPRFRVLAGQGRVLVCSEDESTDLMGQYF